MISEELELDEIRPEEERVASFVQALRRMHDDPAEAARIDAMIAEVDEPVVVDTRRPLVIHVYNNGGTNTVNLAPDHPDITAQGKPKSTDTAPGIEAPQLRGSKHRRRLEPWSLSMVPLALMTVVVVTALVVQPTILLTTVISTSYMAFGAMQIWLDQHRNARDDRYRRERLLIHRKDRELTR